MKKVVELILQHLVVDFRSPSYKCKGGLNMAIRGDMLNALFFDVVLTSSGGHNKVVGH